MKKLSYSSPQEEDVGLWEAVIYCSTKGNRSKRRLCVRIQNLRLSVSLTESEKGEDIAFLLRILCFQNKYIQYLF